MNLSEFQWNNWVLEPAGRGAEQIAELFWWLIGGASLIWLVVMALTIYAIRVQPGKHPGQAGVLIIGGGVILPVIILAGYLIYGLGLLPALLAPEPANALKISVQGEQWWWRISYELEDGNSFELANELRLPVERPIHFELKSSDVIHSFWIPALGGKVDMIPGRVTELLLEPVKTGLFRGMCAEYCGDSHAFMNFYVQVEEWEQFHAWQLRQQQPAEDPKSETSKTGSKLFLSNGCGACHNIRGTMADGTLGPDLTHLGSRLSIGAALLPNTEENLIKWISDTERVKPGVHMPAFNMLSNDELKALATYLRGLK